MLNPVTVELIGKPGCHLCDDARGVVERVLGEFRDANAEPKIQLLELNILEDAELAARFNEEIPVVRINGKIHNYWRIDPVRFREALDEFTKS